MVKRYAGRLSVVVALALILAGCGAKEATVDALLALSNGAIAANQTLDANGQPLLSTADCGAVLTYTTQALQTIQASQNGWQAAVKTGWAAASADIMAKHPNAGVRLKVALAAVTAAVDAL